MEMTIAEAARKVLTENPDGLNIKQIYDIIVENDYYKFDAKDPINALAVQIKRYCIGSKISYPAQHKYFKFTEINGEKIYELIKRRREGDVMRRYEGLFIQTEISNVIIYTFPMKVRDLAEISYVAVRGKDNEEGAVQRVLNRKRISDIKKYVLGGNLFVNTFVLNWTNREIIPIFNENRIAFPLIPAAAQMIDGQHRLEGIKEAMNEDELIGEKTVIVSLAINLETKEAAKIFLNINSEQKPVPKSLIYDLYGVTEEDRYYAINRANDIVDYLNKTVDSPYYSIVKYPGMPRGKGKLDLSTMIDGIKVYLEKNGKFEENNICDLNLQSQIIENYFKALRYHSIKLSLWQNSLQNIFFKAAGFTGAIDFFFDYVLPHCVVKRSFKEETIAQMFDFDGVGIITSKDIVATDGKTARKRVISNLKDAFLSDIPDESDYEI